MHIFKKISAIIFVVFIMLQFVPIKKNISALPAGKNFEQTYKVPPDVADIMKISCYDCHSNHTAYPIYGHIWPMSLVLQKHIGEGKKELNFDSFPNYTDRRKKAKIKSVISQIKEDKMPLRSYKLMHPNSPLSPDDSKVIIHFFENLENP